MGGKREGQVAPTIVDVARSAQVSPMTVSRVINGRENVADKTRAKVLEAVRQLEYAPNTAARSLASGTHSVIALLHTSPSTVYLGELLVGALNGTNSSGAQLVVEQCDGSEDYGEFAARMQSRGVDGVILPPPLCDDSSLMDELHALGLLIVQIATASPAEFAHAVTIEDERAAEAMTEHLIGLGHKRIGFIAGDPNQTASNVRLRGYLRALEKARIGFERQLVVQGDFTYRSGLEAAKALFEQVPRPTAIFASNDHMAAGCVAAAHRHRLKVPLDISIAGYDDTPIADAIWPKLTTVRQPVRDMARVAAGILVEAIQNHCSSHHAATIRQCLQFEIVQRDSVG